MRRQHLQLGFRQTQSDSPLGELARQYTYQEFPNYFTWKDRDKKWEVRKQGFAISRMYFVGPTAGERFYLRSLLSVVKGARSFEELRMVNGVQYDTFHGACLARGLLTDDREWRDCLAEACEMQVGSHLQRLFATVLLFCVLTQPRLLWDEFWRQICDDIPLQLRQVGHLHPIDKIIQDYGLYLLEDILKEHGKSLVDYAGMPRPSRNWAGYRLNLLIAQQLDFNQAEQRRLLNERLPLLNTEQSAVYTSIMRSVEDNLAKVFFISGPGGTGKMFLYNVLCNKLRGDGEIVLCCASSGIAGLLLPGDRTAHSTFKIPINVKHESVCGFTKNCDRTCYKSSSSLSQLQRTPSSFLATTSLYQRTLFVL
ncbi:hypothetical protein NMY22_g17005 [Coprinellus aureogranulatus]|nr:hypothetical protein NMY22_g17005 [Coprinellus aureogranulatus]